MKIRRRLQFIVWISISLVASFSVILLFAIEKVRKADEKAELAVELMTDIFERSSLRDEYLVHFEERPMMQWHRKQNTIIALIEKAGILFADDPAGLDVLDEIRNNQEKNAALFSIITGSDDPSRVGIMEEMLSGQMLAIAADEIADALKLREMSVDARVRAQNNAILLAIIFITAAVMTVVVTSLSAGRIITKRVVRLQKGAELVGGGDLEHVIDLPANDELGLLAASFNEMTVKLRNSYISMETLQEEIRARRKAEEDFRRLNEELDLRVRNRTAELAAANQELESFAYAVSHDLRAPLRALIGFSRALAEDYGEKLDGDALVYLDQITSSGRRMGELIDGLLTLSRCTRGDLARDRVDLSSLSSRLLEVSAGEEPNRAVEWDVAPGLVCWGDAGMIEIAMGNLLRNAWKFTQRTARPKIRVYSEPIDGVTYFCVADNGAGFDMRQEDRLFKPFQRLHRQDEFPGMGIGLATVQRIINRHGGLIKAFATPGQGATFIFCLPSRD